VNPSHRLESLNRAALKRIAKLRSRVSSLRLPVTLDDDARLSWAVIEMLNLWAGFLRAYYLSGAICTRTRSGKSVRFTARKFANADSALRFAILTVKDPKFNKRTFTRYDEPAWHNVQKFTRLENVVAASNLPQVYSALAAGSTFASLLKDVRNFYAHRCDETFITAANVGIKLGLTSKPELRANNILCARLPMRPQNVITDWLDDMTNVVDLLCL
jgi:hypothetical protein